MRRPAANVDGLTRTSVVRVGGCEGVTAGELAAFARIADNPLRRVSLALTHVTELSVAQYGPGLAATKLSNCVLFGCPKSWYTPGVVHHSPTSRTNLVHRCRRPNITDEPNKGTRRLVHTIFYTVAVDIFKLLHVLDKL